MERDVLRRLLSVGMKSLGRYSRRTVNVLPPTVSSRAVMMLTRNASSVRELRCSVLPGYSLNFQGSRPVQVGSKCLFSNECSEAEYEVNASRALTYISEYMDSLPEKVECDESFDVDYAMGVITVRVSPEVGTYVINMQTPNRQIWLSSPVSGPKRYDFVNGKWRYSRDGVALDDLLTQEFRKIFNNETIKFVIE